MKMRFANSHNFFLAEYFEKPIAYMHFDGELSHLTPFIIFSCVLCLSIFLPHGVAELFKQ